VFDSACANAVMSLAELYYLWYVLAWAKLGGGRGGRVPPTFSDGGDILCHVPHFFLFKFCVWRGFENKNDVCHVLCEELFMLGLYCLLFTAKTVCDAIKNKRHL